MEQDDCWRCTLLLPLLIITQARLRSRCAGCSSGSHTANRPRAPLTTPSAAAAAAAAADVASAATAARFGELALDIEGQPAATAAAATCVRDPLQAVGLMAVGQAVW